MESTNSQPLLAYWDIHGRAFPIRLLLAYVGVPYQDRHLHLASGHDMSAWLVEKWSHGLDFPNLPYYIDGEIKLTQSLAILRYLGRKYSLYGSTEEAKIRIDLAEQQVADLRTAFAALTMRPNYSQFAEEFLENLKSISLKQLENFLGTGPWIAGSSISYVDFYLYEYLVKIRAFSPPILEPFPNLTSFVKRLEQLPKVKEYLENRKKKLMINGPKYAWNAEF